MINTKVIWEKNNVLLISQDVEYFIKIKQGIKKRTLEQQAIHHLLKSIDDAIEIDHKPNGAPLIRNSHFSHISISHSKGWYAVYLSQEPIGVDIQYFHKSIEKGKTFFLNKYEEAMFSKSIDLWIIWSAKEAVFKKFEGAVENLKDDLTVCSIDHQNQTLTIKYQDFAINSHFLIAENIVLVWV